MADKGKYDSEYFERKERTEDRCIPEPEREILRGTLEYGIFQLDSAFQEAAVSVARFYDTCEKKHKEGE